MQQLQGENDSEGKKVKQERVVSQQLGVGVTFDTGFVDQMLSSVLSHTCGSCRAFGWCWIRRRRGGIICKSAPKSNAAPEEHPTHLPCGTKGNKRPEKTQREDSAGKKEAGWPGAEIRNKSTDQRKPATLPNQFSVPLWGFWGISLCPPPRCFPNQALILRRGRSKGADRPSNFSLRLLKRASHVQHSKGPLWIKSNSYRLWKR